MYKSPCKNPNRNLGKLVFSATRAALTRATLTVLLFIFAHATAQTNFTLTSSTVTYEASDPRDTWQGVTTLSSLELTPIAGGFEVGATIEPGSFDSGNFIRDSNARIGLFDAGEFPTATLSGTLPLAPEMLQPGAVSSTQKTVLSGELLLHGVTQALTVPITVIREGTELSAEMSFPVALSAFGMKGPSLFGVTVNDQVEVSISLVGDVAVP